VIGIPDQPLAEKILDGALAGDRVPQQFLLFGPPGTGKRQAALAVAGALIGVPAATDIRAQMDLSVVRASGAQILLDDLDDALRDLAARPVVGRCRVVIIEGAERLRLVAADRILKPLEEPPPGSHVILVTDRPDDVLATIRSRCLPVPFRSPGWRLIADRLAATGVSPDEAETRARTEGPMALVGDPFWRSMRAVGVEMGLSVLRGDRGGADVVAAAQQRMEAAAGEHPSDDLVELRRAAAELEGRRGGRTAAKKAEDQQKRERRRMVSDGWDTVLTGAAGVVADGLAVAVGAGDAVRHRDLRDAIAAAGAPAELCIRALEEIEMTRADLALNPTVDLAVEALLVRIGQARRGERHPLRAAGRLPW
jgi:DNA polymerase-3 subunit delta'